ncbi:MAG TPA: type VI secretion system tube protein Hcp [Steroidobacteraceae bacterium]|jgi:type VI protein secretion system component Hcp|nr:type VI secretion system tube protein Hcp [Steroidobacteraceae bacterium]
MQPRTRFFYAALISVLSVAAASNAWADNIYLHVPGVTGPVTTAPYAGDIDILSYSQGFSNSGTTAQCSDTSMEKLIDVTSQYFARNVLEQTGTFNATLHFVNSSAVEDTTIQLNTVRVTSVSHSASNGGIIESLSMHAASLGVTFTDSTGAKKFYTATCP